MSLGKVIRKYRKIRNMTQEEMAGRLGVTAPAVNKWKTKIPSRISPSWRLLPDCWAFLWIPFFLSGRTDSRRDQWDPSRDGTETERRTL